MKRLAYKIYALLFNFFASVCKIKKNRAAFVSMHNENFNDSLGAVFEEMKKRGGFEFVFITKRDLDFSLSGLPNVFGFFFVKARLLASSKYVFLNDNFLPMGGCNFKKDAVVVQLWHAEGVFKKFGLAINQPPFVREAEKKSNEKLSFVVCSSKSVVPFYAQAFGVREENVLPLGSARTDYFFSEENKKKAKENFFSLYPELHGKRLVLYAPTFRDTEEENERLLGMFSQDEFERYAGENTALLLRLHPQIRPEKRKTAAAADVTDYGDVRELALVCDALITDYSSICMDFALLGKKTVFFAFDLERYKADRDFYFDYETYVPGRTVKTAKEAVLALNEPLDGERNEAFVRFNFDFADGRSAGRIVGEAERR